MDRANRYWLSPRRVLIGPYPGALTEREALRKLRSLRRLGVQSIVDLTEPGEHGWRSGVPLEPYQPLWAGLCKRPRVSRFACPVRDVTVPSLDAVLRVLDRVDGWLAADRGAVYIHCQGGKGRAGVMACAWLVAHPEAWLEPGNRHRPDLGRLALERISGLRGDTESPDTAAQVRFIEHLPALLSR